MEYLEIIFLIVIGIICGLMAKRKNRSPLLWLIFAGFGPGFFSGIPLLYVLPPLEEKTSLSQKISRITTEGKKLVHQFYYSAILTTVCFAILIFAIRAETFFPWIPSFLNSMKIFFPVLWPVDWSHEALQSYALIFYTILYNLTFALVLLTILFQLIYVFRDTLFKNIDVYFLLTATIFWLFSIAGYSIWAHQSWGRYWTWDPKELWMLIAFFTLMQSCIISAVTRIIVNSKRGCIVSITFNLFALLILVVARLADYLVLAGLRGN